MSFQKRNIMDDELKMGVNTKYVSTHQKLQPLLRGTITGGQSNLRPSHKTSPKNQITKKSTNPEST